MSDGVYRMPLDWLKRPIRIVQAGVGGTGGEMLDGLVRVHHALLQLGHPSGLSVTVFDPDVVSPSNIGRQRFYAGDVGGNKAEVLVQRLNLFCGLGWDANPAPLAPEKALAGRGCDLLVTCVDSASTRVQIAKRNARIFGETLWLDTGNDATTGQVILGHLGLADDARLPNVADLYPQLAEVEDQDTPSCSLAEALARQDLTVNRAVACAGLNLLWRLLRHAQIEHHGAWIDVAKNRVTPMPICPKSWAGMGYCVDEKVPG